MSAGIPEVIQKQTVKFHYNHPESIEELFAAYPGQIACLVMEVEAGAPPKDGFLQETLRLCHANGALLILDEIITGFRWHLQGAQKMYGIRPDLSTFGKAMGNGFAISALVGRKDVMELGGLQHDKERVFLLSTTFGAESHALAAALATIKVYEEEGVVERLYQQGERLAAGVKQAIEASGVKGYFEVLGKPCNLIFATLDPQGNRSQAYRALFMQEMIRRGIIGPSFVVSYSHTDADIDRTIEAVCESLVIYGRALDEGAEKHLVGRPVKPVFRKFN
jgi:glutamate-1-semialdehyde 2,1-aminomutase